MRLISSPRATFFYQKLAPVIASLLVFVVVGFFVCEWMFSKLPEFFRIAIGLFYAILIYFRAKAFSSKLVDEVWLDGETLIVKQKGMEARIEGEMLRWVDRVGSTAASLVFKSTTPFGRKIVFFPKTESFWGSQDGIIEELQKIQRRHR